LICFETAQAKIAEKLFSAKDRFIAFDQISGLRVKKKAASC